jgi:hypothetical protein
MSILIDPSWSFEQAVAYISQRYMPGSLVSGQARIVAIESWASLVGRESAVAQLDDFVTRTGSISAAARDLQMANKTLKRLRDFFETLPEMRPEKSRNNKLVFLSHSSKDRPFARELAERLKQNGIDVWIDDVDLRIGESLVEAIGDAISRADYVAVIISNNSIKSGWVKHELQLAMARQVAGNELIVLPIVIEQCELPNYLRDRLYADFRDRNNYNNSFARILQTVKSE